MDIILAYVTYETKEDAERIVEHLLKKRLIACANLFPITSMYWWGDIQKGNEIVSILKSTEEKWEKIKDEVRKIHPYKCPCIIKINAQANSEYENYIANEINSNN